MLRPLRPEQRLGRGFGSHDLQKRSWVKGLQVGVRWSPHLTPGSGVGVLWTPRQTLYVVAITHPSQSLGQQTGVPSPALPLPHPPRQPQHSRGSRQCGASASVCGMLRGSCPVNAGIALWVWEMITGALRATSQTAGVEADTAPAHRSSCSSSDLHPNQVLLNIAENGVSSVFLQLRCFLYRNSSCFLWALECGGEARWDLGFWMS